MELFDTTQLLATSSNLIRRSFSANLMRIEPNGQTPILALSGLAKVRKIMSIVHSYYSKTAEFPSVTCDGASGTGTTIVTDDTSQIEEGTMLLGFNITPGVFAAPELIRVDAIASSTDLTVLRGQGGTTPTNFADNTVLIEVGTAFEEGSQAPVARAVATVEHINNTQIFRNTWDVSRTAAAVSLEPDFMQEAENKMDAMFFHGTAIEWSTIFGRKASVVKNGRPLRYMDGIEAIVTDFAPGNVVAAGATTTYKQLESFLHPTLDNKVRGRGYGPKTLFVGSQAREVINEIGRASTFFELIPHMTRFGMQFDTFRTSRGTWEIMEHPLLNTNDVTKKMAIVADFQGFDFQWLTETMHKNIEQSGKDATSGVFTSELTLQLDNPLGWGIIYNLTAGA